MGGEDETRGKGGGRMMDGRELAGLEGEALVPMREGAASLAMVEADGGCEGRIKGEGEGAEIGWARGEDADTPPAPPIGVHCTC